MSSRQNLVSVIIPVYNVENYLNRCIESIIQQTHVKLEIIIIDDGSTDNSLQACMEWKKRDSRIIVCSKANEGLGPTRNLGIKLAHGEFLSFIDSDDWIEPDFIEVLLDASCSTGAELAVCNFRKMYDRNETGDFRSQDVLLKFHHEGAFTVKNYPETLWLMETSTVNRLYTKRLIDKAKIEQPPKAVEDICTVFLYTILAEKVIHVEKILYNYYQRAGSLMNDDNKLNYLIHGMRLTKKNFLQYKLPDLYLSSVKKMLFQALEYYQSIDETKLLYEKKSLETELDSLFPDNDNAKEKEAFIFGSFNLRCIGNEFFYRKPVYYGFSSIISIMSSKTASAYEIVHDNELRRTALIHDIEKTTLQSLKRVSSERRYMLLDFMEERFDILELEKDVYITKSDALVEAHITGLQGSRVIKSGTSDFQDLWEKSCLKFIEMLKGLNSKACVVLIRMRLSEGYGDYKLEHKFENRKQINQTNFFIERMENFFIKNYPECLSICIEDKELIYTNKNFRFGCFPWHLNYDIYIKIMKELEKKLAE